MRSRLRVVVLFACVAGAVRAAEADLTVDVSNGAAVKGKLGAPAQTDTFRALIPAGATITATVKGTKVGKAKAPPVSLQVLREDGTPLSSKPASAKGQSAKGIKAPASERIRIVVGGDGSALGAYQAAVSWKSPKGVAQKLDLGAGELRIPFAADALASLTLSVSAAKSKALPRLVRIEFPDGSVDIAPPSSATASSHKAAGILVPTSGDAVLVVKDAGTEGGSISVKVTIKAPRVVKSTIDVATLHLADEGADDAFVAVIGPSGGKLEAEGPKAGALDGASLQVPPDALSAPTALALGKATDFVPPDKDVVRGGATVFLGPPGQTFAGDATVTVPFDLSAGKDVSKIRVYERDADGSIRLLPSSAYVYDAVSRRVSFPVSHFTSYRVFEQGVRQTKLFPTVPHAGDQFGGPVSLSGDTLAVGSSNEDAGGTDSGAAYVFVRQSGAWTQEVRLAPGVAGDAVGSDVAVDGDTLVASAPFDDTVDVDLGAVYVFTRSGTTWSQQAKITPADAFDSDLLADVALSGDTLLVDASGGAQVYVRSGTTWSMQQKLSDSGAVALQGDTAVVGADFDGVGGQVYVYTRSGTTWTRRATLAPSNVAAGMHFGFAVALDGNTIVGTGDLSLGNLSGGAWVFTGGGSVWTQQAQIASSDLSDGDLFGLTVGISGDTLVVGAPSAKIGGSPFGAAYVFQRAGATWSETYKIVAADVATGDGLGGTVAIQGPTIAASAAGDAEKGVDAGATYVFDLP